MRQPLRGYRGVSQVLLVQDLEGGLVTGELLQHRVGTRARQARIEHLNHHVNGFDALGDRLLGQEHVTREPLNRHRFSL